MIVEKLIDLILLVNSTYVAENVFYAYQNGLKLPTNSQYVIVADTNNDNQCLPVEVFDSITGNLTISNVALAPMQIDYYGINASDEANVMRMILTSQYGNNFLADGGLSVGSQVRLQNLTNNLDREEYVPRYTLTFSIFNNVSYTVTQPSFSYAKITKLVNVVSLP